MKAWSIAYSLYICLLTNQILTLKLKLNRWGTRVHTGVTNNFKTLFEILLKSVYQYFFILNIKVIILKVDRNHSSIITLWLIRLVRLVISSTTVSTGTIVWQTSVKIGEAWSDWISYHLQVVVLLYCTNLLQKRFRYQEVHPEAPPGLSECI